MHVSNIKKNIYIPLYLLPFALTLTKQHLISNERYSILYPLQSVLLKYTCPEKISKNYLRSLGIKFLRGHSNILKYHLKAKIQNT